MATQQLQWSECFITSSGPHEVASVKSSPRHIDSGCQSVLIKLVGAQRKYKFHQFCPAILYLSTLLLEPNVERDTIS